MRQGRVAQPRSVREPGDDRIYYGRSVTSGDYLPLLAANGYTLSAVEKVVTGTRTLMRSTTNTWPRPARSEPPGGAGLRFCPTPTPAAEIQAEAPAALQHRRAAQRCRRHALTASRSDRPVWRLCSKRFSRRLVPWRRLAK